MSYFGWKSWLGAGDGVRFELLMMMREARNRKSSNNCWMRDAPAEKSRTSRGSGGESQSEKSQERV